VNGDAHHPSWGMRVLAPLAFFAAATILVLLVQDALNAGNETASPPVAEPQAANPGRTPRAATGTQTGVTGPQAQRRFYVIRSGDTLETIAARFQTTVEDLVELNPNIDPNALQPGQRIRIR
jgi:Tfp pilus assembly protein FimV